MVNRNGLGIRRDFEPTLTNAQLLEIKRALAQNLSGGVIVEVATVEQACLAEQAGAVAVMALGRDLDRIEAILQAVRVPVMAQVHSNRVAEALTLQEIGVGFIEEKDGDGFTDKGLLTVPVISHAQTAAQALHQIEAGTSMLRTNTLHLVKNLVEEVTSLNDDDLTRYAQKVTVSRAIVEEIRHAGRLPAAVFLGYETGIDARHSALVRRSGIDGIFAHIGIFNGSDPASAITEIVSAIR